jgi:FkbM family methyltransferase
MPSPETLRTLVAPLRALPPGFGQPRAAHKIHHRWLRTHGGAPRQARVGAATMRLDLRDTMQAEAYLLGGYEPELVKYILRRLPAGGTLVDVGANIGLITLPVLAANVTARAIAFEPHPGNAQTLRDNVAMNPGVQVDVREVALGAQPGSVTLTSADPLESGWFRVEAGGPGIAVAMDTLDLALGDMRVDVMKVDAEGSEPAILQGARTLLAERRVRYLIMEANAGLEVSGEDLGGFVAQFGYRQTDVPAPIGRRLRRLSEESVVFTPG